MAEVSSWNILWFALRAQCPKCRSSSIYTSLFSFKMKEVCDHCELKLCNHDNADGPAVFVMAILCFIIVPAALVLDFMIQPSMWVHAAIWGSLTIFLSFLGLKPMTGLLIYMQFKHRPLDFGEAGDE